jgi:O-antigen/teichoic acid export membrane protein
MVLIFGVILMVLTVILNMIFIPIYGINGSAFATFIAILVYNTIKIIFVKQKFKMLPFTDSTLKLSILIVIFTLGFYFWDFPFHPILNMVLKSVLIGLLYTIVIFRMNISDDISAILKKYLRLN